MNSMRVIKYISLFQYLTQEEGLKPSEAYRNIKRIRKLPAELKEAVDAVLSSSVPDVSYEDVSYSDLTEDGMKPIRAILMLDWIRREPMAALRYLSQERLRSYLIMETEEEASGQADQENQADIEI